MPTRALLLIAHGSRRPEANADLDHVADQLRGGGAYHHVGTAYLELAEPSIPDGAGACVAAGADAVVMLPYFLSPGVHVRDDLERFRAELTAAHPGVRFALAEPLGRHPLLLRVVEERARAAEA